ncbi:MAG: precorrin-6y C5,15-methyltransferase (decarboxylating) subunit CbiE, partial [Alphaproteobacteria bacterium]
GLTPAARALVQGAEVLVGGERHLAMVPNGIAAERLAWQRPFASTFDEIARARGRRVTVLATGDPMAFGVGVNLVQRFGRDEMVIVPAPGAVSLACARLGWAAAEVESMSLLGRPLDILNLHLAPGARLVVLGEDGEAPGLGARRLVETGYGPSRMVVLEHMGGRLERVLDSTADSWGARPTADFCTIAVECRPGPGARVVARAPGLPDDLFRHDGQLTKREVRASTLAALAPLPRQLLWDVGAGCGSVAIEWLRGARGSSAVAIEREATRAALIAANAASLGVPELEIVTGTAPECLGGLEAPDAVFIGGGIGQPGLAESCWAALKPGGRLVANVVTVEGESALFRLSERTGGALARIAVSRAEPMGRFTGWRALAPVTQLRATKPSVCPAA